MHAHTWPKPTENLYSPDMMVNSAHKP